MKRLREAMRVYIQYGDSFDLLSKPLASYTHTRAIELVRDAIKEGHARYAFYVITRAPDKAKMPEKVKQYLRTLKETRNEAR